MPCASKPVRSASIICLAAISASAAGTPHASKASRANAVIAAIEYPGIVLRRNRPRLPREILVQPVVDDAADARVALRKHEVIGFREEMQVAGLAGALEHLNRLLGRRDRIDR